MAYDPKKKRPSTKSLDSVVDEIFGAETPDESSADSIESKPKSDIPVNELASKESVKDIHSDMGQEHSESEEAIPNNVTSLYPESSETPLSMQPQIWIPTAIAAISAVVVFFLIKKRR